MADIKRINEPDDANRCQHNIPTKGQCINIAVPGTKFCIVHGGNIAEASLNKKELRNYKLTQYHARAVAMGNSAGITSLRDEIAILRIMLEERWNMLTDSSELLIAAPFIASLVASIEKVVNSCHKIDIQKGNLVDKGELIDFAQRIIEIISESIEDTDQLEVIANKIIALFATDPKDQLS